jgi:hypothetical protein
LPTSGQLQLRDYEPREELDTGNPPRPKVLRAAGGLPPSEQAV